MSIFARIFKTSVRIANTPLLVLLYPSTTFTMSESELQNTHVGRRQYLITYSQADMNRFPTRESFGKMLESEFNAGKSRAKVSYWACCKESHEEHGFHYHCCIKLSDVKKWLAVKNEITKKYGIVVNFSDTHNHYIYAYRYVCKSDKEVVLSESHPDLSEVGSPRTKASTTAHREASKKRKSTGDMQESAARKSSKVKRRLSNLEVSDFILRHNIRGIQELFSKADDRKKNGECDLANFLFSRTQKFIDELISKSWMLQQASSDLAREKVSRIDKVRDAATKSCIEGCNTDWFQCAIEVLLLNDIEPAVFSSYLFDLLAEGRGKFRNLMIYGRSNCAKTFMLKPLKCIFGDRLFDNPANDKYAWVGADKAEVIVLQDFRFSKDVISWKDLLLLLEGETVKLPAPKNHFSTDVAITSDVPIFATTKAPIVFKGPFNAEDERETEMMNSRWRMIRFKHAFEEKNQKNLIPCGSCFARLVLLAGE